MNKFRKTIAAVAVMTAAVSAFGAGVSAADWSQASYADSDPSTVEILGTDKDGVDFCNSATNTDICKVRITLDKVLKNREDYAKIDKMEWDVTYTGISDKFTADVLSGGTYLTNNSSVGYSIRCEDFDETADKPIWKEPEYTVQDYFKVPENMPLEKDGELVFMDWSFADITNQGIKVRISNLKIYDKDGNEIEQLGYNEWDASMSADVIDTGAGNPTHKDDDKSDEEDKSEDEKTEEEAPAEDKETAAEEDTSSEKEDASEKTEDIDTIPKTGNESVAVAGIVMAAAGLGYVLVNKRKNK